MSPDQRPTLRVLVTGASGFIGGRVVETLALTGAARPVAGIRKWSRGARAARFPVEIVPCDILDAAQVRDAVARVDAVVHCAYTNDRESIVEGTRNLLQASIKARLRSFVYLSTAEVYGPAQGEIEEAHRVQNTGWAYADAKIEAEALCRDASEQGLPSTVLRPSIIYGPFGQSWTVNIAQRLLSGNWAQFEQHGEGIANLVYVDDVVQAVFRALTALRASGESFNVNGPDVLTWNEYFQLFNDALEQPPLRTLSSGKSRMRTSIISGVDWLTGAIRTRFEDQLMEIYLRGGWASQCMKRVKRALETTPTKDELERLYSRQARYVDTKIRSTLNYSPAYDIHRGLQASISWLRHHRMIPERDLQIADRETATPPARPQPAVDKRVVAQGGLS